MMSTVQMGTFVRSLAAVLVALGAALISPAARAQTDAKVDLLRNCSQLVSHDFSGVKDAPSLVVSAVVRLAGEELPAHCLVDGQIAPTIGYRMWLPTTAWNGKLIQAGCGGRCGYILDEGCQIVLMRGYACLAADLGHKGTMYDNLWAIDNVPGEIDFGFRATHVSNLTARAVTAQFYGRPPTRTYYIGASTGGRQGLVEAQRFPRDFDGIVAGEPAMGTPGAAQPEVGPRLRDAVLALSPAGKPLVTPAELLEVNRQAIARCDLDDGVRDGIISDPKHCDFSPTQLLCKGAKSDRCLLSEQVAALTKVYEAGALPGSEKAWIGAYVRADGSMGRYGTAPENPYRYPYAWIFNDATNPDLRAFKAAGGKLILYQGWADEACFPDNPVLYYETVERLMGSRAATQDFFRLFMIPGQSHIPGNGGAETVDYLGYLEAWVEHDVAPDTLLAQKLKQAARFAGPVTFPVYLANNNVAFERPVYPYPTQAHYRGGDPNAASSFGPFSPTR